jgi:hypothetical protein
MKKPDASSGSGSTTIYTFAVLHDAALMSLEAAKRSNRYPFFECLHAIVDSAFFLEAYLNHVGPQLLRFWSSLDRLSPRLKRDVVVSHLKLKPDYKSRPWQSFELAFSVRDSAAHGRTEIIEFEGRLKRTKDGHPRRPLSSLEKRCKLSIAENIVADARAIVTEIHEARGGKGSPLWFTSNTQWSATYHTE